MRLLLVIAFAACGTREAPATPGTSESTSADNTATAGEQAADDPSIELDPSPEPNIELAVNHEEGKVGLRLRVLGPSANLRRTVRVEKHTGDEWVVLDTPYSLRSSCEVPSEGCIELAAGAELAPPLARQDGQCGSEPLAPGRYRFVVESCAPAGTRPHKQSAEVVVGSSNSNAPNSNSNSNSNSNGQ